MRSLQQIIEMDKRETETMPNIIEITDFQDKNLDVYARLTENQLRNKRNPSEGIFIAESPNVIALALKAGCVPKSLLMEKKHIEGKGADIIALCGDVPVYTGESELLEKLTGFQLTRGILCAMARPARSSVEVVCTGARRLAVLDGIVDSTNIGAIFRSAAALHMDGILITENCCDPLCRRGVRVSMGSVFQIPWGIISGDYLAQLKQLEFKTAAMALSDRAVDIDHPDLMGEDKLAIILGTEGSGLAQAVIDRCDYTACIPMSHGVDSLNVAAASAVAFWQLRVK